MRMTAKFHLLFTRTLKQVVRPDGADFTKFGVLPFLQYRINQTLANNDGSNVNPTRDQANMLSVLQKPQSLIMKSNVQSGKSLALLVHTINSCLKSVAVSSRASIQSVIVVPNNSLLLKYRLWAQSLIDEIDPNCVATSRSNNSMVREPLKIQIIDSSRHKFNLSTDKSLISRPKFLPHILIINSKAFHRGFMNIKNVPNPRDYLNCKFIAIDEADFQVSSSMASSDNTNVTKVGKKNRFELLLADSIRKLKEAQLALFKESPLVNKHFEPIKFCFLFHSLHPFQNMFLKMANGKGSITNSESDNLSTVVKQFNVAKNDPSQSYDPKVSLVKKLIRMTDDEFEACGTQQTLVSIDEFDKTQFYKKSTQGQVEKRINLSLVEPIRYMKNSDKISITSLDPISNLPDRQSYIKYFEKYAKDFSFQINNTFKQYLKERTQLDILRGVMKHGNRKVQLYKILTYSLSTFRKKFPDNNGPILFVLPPKIDLTYLTRRLNDTFENEKFLVYKEFKDITNETQSEELVQYSDDQMFSSSPLHNFFTNQMSNESDIPDNLIFPSNELPGVDVSGVKNMVILDLPLLYTQYSSASWSQNTKNQLVDDISGIEVPYNDLFYYYLLKLQMDQDTDDRNVLFVLDSYISKMKNQKLVRNMFKTDKRRLSETMLLNDVAALVNYKGPFADKELHKHATEDTTVAIYY